MTDQTIEQLARETLNARCEYLDGMARGQAFIKIENALLAVQDALLEGERRGMEKAAGIVDQCNRDGPYNAIGAAKIIRSAIP